MLNKIARPINLATILFLMFQAVFTWAQAPMDVIDAGFSALGDWVKATLPDTLFRSFIADGVIAGVGTVIVFLPQILILFALILVLEASGYMARAAFLMDELMLRVGLNGRAFIPLLSSFACAIPGMMAARVIETLEARGFGLWAVEVPGSIPFAGFVGLSIPRFEVHFTPCVEIGWRLAREAWGHGYATEGAEAALKHGFDVVGLPEIVSFTVPANLRSWRVMEKIGMRRDPADDFDHPLLPDGHRLKRHLLYRLTRDAWRGAAAV